MTSSSLWEMYTTAMFFAVSFLMTPNSVSVSDSDREDVGLVHDNHPGIAGQGARPISSICC